MLHFSKKILVLAVASAAAIVFSLIFIYNNSKDPLVWRTIEAYDYSISVPAEWEGMRNLTGYVERKKWSDSDPDDISTQCDAKSYTAKLNIWENDAASFNFRRKDGTTSFVLTKEDVYEYISLKRGQVILERELGNGALLIVSDGRYASAPCISNQYMGIIVSGEKAIWISLAMDEKRDDIVLPLYSSITAL